MLPAAFRRPCRGHASKRKACGSRKGGSRVRSRPNTDTVVKGERSLAFTNGGTTAAPSEFTLRRRAFDLKVVVPVEEEQLLALRGPDLAVLGHEHGERRSPWGQSRGSGEGRRPVPLTGGPTEGTLSVESKGPSIPPTSLSFESTLVSAPWLGPLPLRITHHSSVRR